MLPIDQQLALLQEYLRTHTLEQLNIEHGIRGKTDGLHLILDYDQIEVNWSQSVFGHICRGIILDAKTFDLIALGLIKFFNSGEHYCESLDWSTVKVQEKLDGSMVQRWWSPHTDRWEYSTRFQLPQDIEKNNVGDFGLNWRQLIEKCLNTLPELGQPKNQTFVLEVMSPYNKIVVAHQTFSAKLICIRDLSTLKEISVEPTGLGPKLFAFTDSKQVEEFSATLKGTECEGFVCVDADFNRCKIKGNNYVYLHRLKDNLNSMKNLILLARSNDFEEVTVHFPEYKDHVLTCDAIIKDFIDRHEKVYEQYRGIDSQKDFALAIKASGLEFTGALFATRSGKAKSVKESILHMEDTQFVKLFKPLVQKQVGSIIEDT